MHPGIKDIQVFLTHTNMNLPAPAPRGLAPPPPWQRAAFWQSMLILLTHPHPSH